MPPLTVLLKPASGSCNMRCSYCFYADEAQNRATENYGMMSEATLEAVVRECLARAEGSCSFGFQGGEPTLRGLGFFRRCTALVEQYRPSGLAVSYFLQTNGLLLDESWAAFFREHRFLVGLSLDGDKELHDACRPDAAGKGTFNRALRAARLLDRFGVEYNVLTVVTARTARSIRRVYRFFMKNGLVYQQYIPCLDPLGEPRGLHPWSLTPEAYGEFLIRLFDEWYADRRAGRFVYIRYFENLAALMLGRPPESCGMLGHCGPQLVVEADGSAYPCDFYMLDDYRLGNFNTDGLPGMEARREEIGFLKESFLGLERCRTCRWARLCRGGCRRDRQGVGLHEIGQNYFCPAYLRFFEYAAPKLATLL